MTDGPYSCPICGAPSVHPHRDSLCRKHYPGEPPDPDDTPENAIQNRDPLAEARAVAGDPEPTPSRSDQNGISWEFADWLLQDELQDDEPDEGAFLEAAMGDPEAAEQFQQDETESVDTSTSTAGRVAAPTAALPIGQLEAIDPPDARELARQRGLTWPSTEEARDRLEDAIFQVIRNEDHRVVDAPTSLGKTHTVAATRWGARDDVTDDRPVVHLLETRDARDEAVEIAEEHGGRYLVLRSRHEACPVAAGDYDPEPVEETDREPVTIGGEPASEWLSSVCDAGGRGIPFSAAHRYLEDHNDQGEDLPCHHEGEHAGTCDAIAQWNEFRQGDYPLVIATHNFAYAPGLRMANNLVVDEEPDFEQDELDTDRVRRTVGAYLREIDAPAQTWEEFIQLATFDPENWDAVAEEVQRDRDALQEALDVEPDREWYFEEPDAHILAPALARAIFNAEERANGRRASTTPYEPPRLEANAREDELWNREWVTVVLDESNDVRTVRVRPDFGACRSLVGLDAHPALPLWQANTSPWIQKREVLDSQERQLWRRHERGLQVVQVGDATRPLASGEYFDYQGTEAIVDQLREEYGADFRTAITAKSVEGELKSIMADHVADPETMHYGEEKSRNDFADEDVGLVLGCIDPGDDYVLDLLAELDLEATPERSDPEDCDDPENAHCDRCDGDGCQECLGTGLKRAQGRGFDGEDAATAQAILASVRENHTAQAAGRYARTPEDPRDTATVFVRTDAMPPGFADVQVPGVAWTFEKKQERIVEVLREAARPMSSREIAAEADCSKEHVRTTLERLHDHDRVHAVEKAGEHGATLYTDSGLPNSGVVDLDAETANSPVWGSYTWALAIDDPDDESSAVTRQDGETTTPADPVWAWEEADDPGG